MLSRGGSDPPRDFVRLLGGWLPRFPTLAGLLLELRGEIVHVRRELRGMSAELRSLERETHLPWVDDLSTREDVVALGARADDRLDRLAVDLKAFLKCVGT